MFIIPSYGIKLSRRVVVIEDRSTSRFPSKLAERTESCWLARSAHEAINLTHSTNWLFQQVHNVPVDLLPPKVIANVLAGYVLRTGIQILPKTGFFTKRHEIVGALEIPECVL
jgi:hypothetical protein